MKKIGKLTYVETYEYKDGYREPEIGYKIWMNGRLISMQENFNTEKEALKDATKLWGGYT